MRALAIAATGMNAQQTNVEVIANNIANINTTGFKRARAEFTDLLYQVERMQGVQNRGGEGVVPEGAELGLGVRLAAIRNLNLQGTLNQTGNNLDLALNGAGWFQVQGPNGETLYTRDGAFNTNAQGQMVTLDGYLVDPQITIPQGATGISVSENGQVSYSLAGVATQDSARSRSSPSRTRQDCPHRAATCSARPSHPARPSRACRATRAMPPSSRAISRIPTSIPSRKSPS